MYDKKNKRVKLDWDDDANPLLLLLLLLLLGILVSFFLVDEGRDGKTPSLNCRRRRQETLEKTFDALLLLFLLKGGAQMKQVCACLVSIRIPVE